MIRFGVESGTRSRAAERISTTGLQGGIERIHEEILQTIIYHPKQEEGKTEFAEGVLTQHTYSQTTAIVLEIDYILRYTRFCLLTWY